MTQNSVPPDLQKIRFYLDQKEDDGGLWPPVAAERVWTKPLGDGLYAVDNVPFWVYGVNIGDVVKAEDRGEDFPVFIEVRRRSGHSTYRVWIEDDASAEQVLTMLKNGGCYIERGYERMAAIDIPPGPDALVLARLIFAAADTNVWDVDEGYWAGGRGDN